MHQHFGIAFCAGVVGFVVATAPLAEAGDSPQKAPNASASTAARPPPVQHVIRDIHLDSRPLQRDNRPVGQDRQTVQKDWLSVIQKSRYGGNANQPSKDIQPRRGERHTLRIESDRVANEAAKWQRHDASTGTSSVKQWSGGKLLGNGQAAGNANSNGPPGQDLADDEPAAENDGQDVQNALQSGDFSQLAADLQKLLGDRLEDRADREKLQAVAAELAAEVERLLGGRSGSNSD